VNHLIKTKTKNTKYNKYKLYEIMFPEKYQKSLLGNAFKKVIPNIVRVPLKDYIFLLNTIETKDCIKKIIEHFILCFEYLIKI
jgi:hypothetical protein